MQNLSQLTEKIEEKLRANKEHFEAYRQGLFQQHKIRSDRTAIYDAEVDRIINDIIRPRMEILAGYFENASLALKDAKTSDTACCNIMFGNTLQFPAKVSLGFSLSHDAGLKILYVACDLEILPVFIKFDKRNTLDVNPSAADSAHISDWVEARILSFLDTYFQLSILEQYQKENLVLDPVCNVLVNKAFVEEEVLLESYHYYFCTQECHDKFLADPLRYR